MRSSTVRRALPRFLFPDGVPAGAAADFQLNNLPYGVFKPNGGDARVGVALGDKVLDLRALVARGLLPQNCGLSESTLNSFMASGSQAWHEVRHELQQTLLSDDSQKNLSSRNDVLQEAVHSQDAVEMLLPADIGDYTDFYASREHATNVGKMFRPHMAPLLPNWLHLPVGYHGRASSVVVSGTGIRRPRGQNIPKGQDGPPPSFGPEKLLDIELEMACFLGPGNAMGDPIPLEKAEDHIFGVVLMNDWSARGIQKWEMVPLGPFLGKNFGTTISPWVVPLAALEPFRTATPPQDNPEPLPYLKQSAGSKQAFDIKLEVDMQTQEMSAPETIIRSNLKYMYWSLAQQLAHHTINGCSMRPGDLLGTGTISGTDEGSYGSLLELIWAGEKEIKLDGGKVVRKFLEDGDKIVIRGSCENSDGTRLGFGECAGVILPAR
mmetsp:Transcript_113198/g.330855  ORF Transcript_113198/g.330855 Transcript_113198/m.330855 type:complete len:436 (+) Transcript_113198:59-1366(+)